MSARLELVAIVAMTKNRVIGKDGGMPWHLPADLAHFRRLSVGKPNIMGRKVYDSLGQALPGRDNIVLTRNPGFLAPGCSVVHTPQEALKAAGDAPEIAILGGEEIYRLYLQKLTRVEQTVIHAVLDGDTFFPELPGEWEVSAERERAADEKTVTT
ncbi:dihydrofolate reductase [Deinococcus malanensis]|uniref:dihydrofolate reductase n=1 Tax=Deinococcus malanensis TaxID=1706855 RepID=UPI0036407298